MVRVKVRVCPPHQLVGVELEQEEHDAEDDRHEHQTARRDQTRQDKSVQVRRSVS